jgi:hypothetical protein
MRCNGGQAAAEKTPYVWGIYKPLQRMNFIDNEQESGSSPLVDSPFCCDLQEKRKSGRTRSNPKLQQPYCNPSLAKNYITATRIHRLLFR